MLCFHNTVLARLYLKHTIYSSVGTLQIVNLMMPLVKVNHNNIKQMRDTILAFK